AQLLFQDPRAMLNPYLPIGLVLEESAVLHGRGRNLHHEVQRILKAVSLDGRASSYPHQLSGGELRRAGLARLLLTRPDLVVVDEPATGLDAALKADLLELLFHHVGDDCAIVIISHDVSLVSWACHSVMVMHLGEMVDSYDTESLYRESATRHPYTLTLLRAAGYSFDVTEVGLEP
ncbi:MAG: ATP-binding cassette domain-containing protein, partial [Proteobacteria bacterium]|nr:ATP-binding cassette domain-containing protein [Pseudomonadota bacterium]